MIELVGPVTERSCKRGFLVEEFCSMGILHGHIFWDWVCNVFTWGDVILLQSWSLTRRHVPSQSWSCYKGILLKRLSCYRGVIQLRNSPWIHVGGLAMTLSWGYIWGFVPIKKIKVCVRFFTWIVIEVYFSSDFG